MLTAYLLVAIAAAAGITLFARGVFAPAPKLADLADGTYRARQVANVDVSLSGRVRNYLLQLFPESQLLKGSMAADLRLTRTTEEAHIIAKFAAAAQGFALGVAVGIVGLALSMPALMLAAGPAAVALAGAAFFLPDASVKSQAAERREEFVSAFAAYLDLTRILMGASDGPESALEKAAHKGHGWVFAEIRRAIDLARGDQTMKHWDALAELGRELDIIELREFADSLKATSTSQALPDTLAARAASMRHKAMRGIEGQADSKTEQMDIPMTLLTMASTIFVMYAAINLTTAAETVFA